jgi:hypothetical protein
METKGMIREASASKLLELKPLGIVGFLVLPELQQ